LAASLILCVFDFVQRARVEVKISGFEKFGKNYLKAMRVHPDTCVQLALQLGYYRMHGK
jgi:hypothetical protein